MRYFVDTGYWIARLSREDQWHAKAVALSKAFAASDHFFTTDLIIVELLNYFSNAGEIHRANASILADWIESDPQHQMVFVSRSLLKEARTFYESHSDKSWSLTDCSSFLVMKDL